MTERGAGAAKEPLALAASEDRGSLGVIHLKRLWSRSLLTRSGRAPEFSSDEWARDVLVMDGLGIGIENTIRYLFEAAPSFAAFEHWVLEKNGGDLEPSRVARLNDALLGRRAPDASSTRDASEGALGKEDLAFWSEHGYVVVHDAISAEECAAAARAVWDFVGMDPNDPESWYRQPRASIMVPLYRHPALEATRRAPRVRAAFAQIWGRDDLWASTDRCSLNFPERPGFAFPGPRLHWDTTLAPPVQFSVQGLVYLTDTAAQQGAFTCVPGFHRRVDAWLRGLPAGSDPHEQDLEALGAVPIAGRAGDLVIWNDALPHGSRPNRAERPRIVQYIKMYPPPRATSEALR